MVNPLSKAQLREVEQGLYALNEAKQHLEILRKMGEDVDEKELRIAHLEAQLTVLRNEYSGVKS